MKFNWKIALPSTIAVAASAVAIAVPIVIANTARSQAVQRLSNFVSLGGAAQQFDLTKPLNVVAIGDSETAGFNGYLSNALTANSGYSTERGGGDYLSYADFFAQSLKNHLGEDKVVYKNLAVSGYVISDVSKQFLSPDVRANLAAANIITLTIGANDLLRVIDILGRNFWGAIDLIGDFTAYYAREKAIAEADAAADSEAERTAAERAALATTRAASKKARYTAQLKTVRDKLFNPENRAGLKDTVLGGAPTSFASAEGLRADFAEAWASINGLLDGKYEAILGIDGRYRDTIFDSLRRALALLIHDLHTVAPQAQIVVLGPAMPFGQWPAQVLDNANPNMPENLSLNSGFTKILDTMERGVKTGLNGNNDFVDFYKMDDLAQFRAKHFRRVKPGTLSDPAYVKTNVINNAMPNAVDIHPSTFGHDLVGDGLFRAFAPRLNITVDESKIQHSISKLALESAPTDLYNPASRLDSKDQAALTALALDPNNNGVQPSELITFQNAARGILATKHLWYRFDEDVELLKNVRDNTTTLLLSALDPAGPVSKIIAFAPVLKSYLDNTDVEVAHNQLFGTIKSAGGLLFRSFYDNQIKTLRASTIDLGVGDTGEGEATPGITITSLLKEATNTARAAKAEYDRVQAAGETWDANNPQYDAYESVKKFDLENIADFNTDAEAATNKVFNDLFTAIWQSPALEPALSRLSLVQGLDQMVTARKTLLDKTAPLANLETAYLEFFATFTDLAFNLSLEQIATELIANFSREFATNHPKSQPFAQGFILGFLGDQI